MLGGIRGSRDRVQLLSDRDILGVGEKTATEARQPLVKSCGRGDPQSQSCGMWVEIHFQTRDGCFRYPM